MEVEDAYRAHPNIRKQISRFARSRRRAIINFKRRTMLPRTRTNINALHQLSKQISKHARLRRKIATINKYSRLLVPQKLELAIQCLNTFVASTSTIRNDTPINYYCTTYILYFIVLWHQIACNVIYVFGFEHSRRPYKSKF